MHNTTLPREMPMGIGDRRVGEEKAGTTVLGIHESKVTECVKQEKGDTVTFASHMWVAVRCENHNSVTMSVAHHKRGFMLVAHNTRVTMSVAHHMSVLKPSPLHH